MVGPLVWWEVPELLPIAYWTARVSRGSLGMEWSFVVVAASIGCERRYSDLAA